jgi:apolipoprotein N-acyltransferase
MSSYNAIAYDSFMDDLILAGALSIIGLYTAAIIAVAAVVFMLMEVYAAAATGNSGRITAILVIVLLFLAAYAGTGLWLQKRDHI